MPENKIQVKIGAENQSAGAFAQAEASLKSLEQVANGAIKMLEGLALLEAGRKLLEFAGNTLEAEANLAKMSERTGVAVDQLSQLTYAANLSGVSTDKLEVGIKKLQVTLSAAAAGDAKAAAALASVGVNARDSQGKVLGAADALEKIAAKFADTKDGSDKAALAVQIFGRSGTQLIPLLDKGQAGIAALREEAERLGVVLSADDAQSAELFEQNVMRLEATSRGLMQHLESGLVPALNQVFSAIEGPGKKDFDAMHDAGEKLGAVVKDVALAFETVGITVAINAPKIAGFAQAVMGLMNQNPTTTAMGIEAMIQATDKGVTDQLLLKLQKFREALDAPPPKANAEPESSITRQPVAVADDSSLVRAQLKTKLDAEKEAADESKALRDLEMASLDALYKHELISVQEYFDKKRQLQIEDAQQAETSAFNETQLVNAQIKSLDAEIAKMKEKGAATADIVKKETEREGLIQQSDAATSKLTVTTEKLNVALGKAPSGDADPLAERARQMEIYAAEAQQVGGKIDQVYAKLAADIEAVSTAEKNHEITGQQAQTKINALNEQARVDVQGMVSDYESLAKASGDGKLIDNAEKLRKKYEELGKQLNWVRDTALDGLQNDMENFFTDMISGTKSAADAFKDFAASIIDDIAKIIAKMIAMYIIEKLLGLFLGAVGGGGGGGGADFLGADFSDEAGDVPFFAAGGRVGAGEMAIVGENGPEPFIPDTSGTILSNDKLQSMAGGGGNTYYMDFSNADPGSEQRIMRMIQQAGLITRDASVSKVSDLKRRGIAFA